jgi:hypothetical protein
VRIIDVEIDLVDRDEFGERKALQIDIGRKDIADLGIRHVELSGNGTSRYLKIFQSIEDKKRREVCGLFVSFYKREAFIRLEAAARTFPSPLLQQDSKERTVLEYRMKKSTGTMSSLRTT